WPLEPSESLLILNSPGKMIIFHLPRRYRLRAWWEGINH
ncbi:MAG: hypothetical protein, partial [Olavius algarvensis spirochete endosymbiont]